MGISLSKDNQSSVVAAAEELANFLQTFNLRKDSTTFLGRLGHEVTVALRDPTLITHVLDVAHSFSSTNCVGRIRFQEDTIERMQTLNIKAVPHEKIEFIKKNLQIILRELNMLKKSKRNVIKTFPGFRRRRKDIINKFDKMADSLDLHNKNVNIANVAGSSVGLAGAGIAAVGFALPVTLPLIIPLGIISGIAGGLTNIGANITGGILSKKILTDMKKYLEEDSSDMEKYKEWLQRSQILNDAIKQIMPNSLLEEVFAIVKIIKSFRRMSGPSYLKMMLFLCSAILGMPFCQDLAIILTNTELLNLALAIADSYENNRFLYRGVMSTLRIMGIYNVSFQAFDILSTASTVLKIGGGAARVAAKSLDVLRIGGRVMAVSAALDIVNLIMTSKDLHKGSKTKEAADLRNIRGMLIEELQIFEEIFEEINK